MAKKLPTEQEILEFIKEQVAEDCERLKDVRMCAICNRHKHNVTEFKLYEGINTYVCEECVESIKAALHKSLNAWLMQVLLSKNLPFAGVVLDIISDETFLEPHIENLKNHISDNIFHNDKGDESESV